MPFIFPHAPRLTVIQCNRWGKPFEFKMLTALTEQAGGQTARFVAAVSGRTQKKDLFAAPKTLPFNDFSHFPNAPDARFDRRSTLRLNLIGPAARSRAAKTRMNTSFPP